jgi:hypothetical protein
MLICIVFCLTMNAEKVSMIYRLQNTDIDSCHNQLMRSHLKKAKKNKKTKNKKQKQIGEVQTYTYPKKQWPPMS